MTSVRRVAVVGGGIAGLAAAHRLTELAPAVEINLFEAGDRLGGVLQTVRQDGFLIERGADNFVANVPWGLDLCRRLGLTDELVSADVRYRQARVVHGGRLVGVPRGFRLLLPTRLWPILTSGLLSPWGKLRLLGELFVPPCQSPGDESLASFARRRLGREVFERLVQPLVGGIYTADPERLSMAATLPQYREMERQHGSLIAAALQDPSHRNDAVRDSSGANYGLFVAPRAGMASIVEALAARLPSGSVRLNCPVNKIDREQEGRWRLDVCSAGDAHETVEVDAVILAVPSFRTANLIGDLAPALAGDLGRIAYASSSVVMLGLRQEQLPAPIDYFGFVVPAVEQRRILAASFASVKFPGRAPEGQLLVRVFIGGALQPGLAELPDDALCRLAIEEVIDLLEVRGQPDVLGVARWPAAMPQYHVGHCELVDSIERAAAELGGIALAGSAYRGVGIGHCIHSGERAAENVLSLTSQPQR